MLRSRPVTLLLAAAVGALVVAGLAVHGAVGAVLLLVVAGILVVLSTVTWARTPSRGRNVRVLIVAVILVVAVVKILEGRS